MPSHSSRSDKLISNFDPSRLAEHFSQSLSAEKPWKSIEEFVTSKAYLGYKPYPKQMTLLRLIFLETENMTAFDLETIEKWRKGFGEDKSVSWGVQADIWERVAWLKEQGYRRFPHVTTVMGRRGGKGWIGSVLAAEQIAFMISLGNWQKFFGVQAGKACYISSIATNYDQAKKFLFSDISEAINSCAYIKPYINVSNEYLITVYSPNDVAKIAAAKAKKQKLPDRDLASIRAIAMPAASASGRGGVGLSNCYDEFAHMLNGTGGPADSSTVYKAYQPSLLQFKKYGLTYIPSSPLTKVGKFYELYEEGSVLMPEYLAKIGEAKEKTEEGKDEVVANPRMLIYQGPSWSLYEEWEKAPELYGWDFPNGAGVNEDDDELTIAAKMNPTMYKVEYLGQFAEVEDAYLSPEKVDAMFAPFWGGRTLEPASFGQVQYEYHAHMDPSSVTANFALAIGHLEQSPEPDEHGHYWPHVIFDYLKVWKPSDFEDGVDYVQVTEEIAALMMKYPSLKDFTTDQYNLAGLLSYLKKVKHPARIYEENFNKQSNMKRAEKFKGALNLGWIHAYRDDFYGEDHDRSLLELELKFLSEKNGQVVKQDIGPVITKDLADCVMSVSVRLLEKELDNYAAQLMSGMQPHLSQAQLTRVVDRATTQGDTAQKMSDLTRGMARRQGSTGPRWTRR